MLSQKTFSCNLYFGLDSVFVVLSADLVHFNDFFCWEGWEHFAEFEEFSFISFCGLGERLFLSLTVLFYSFQYFLMYFWSKLGRKERRGF